MIWATIRPDQPAYSRTSAVKCSAIASAGGTIVRHRCHDDVVLDERVDDHQCLQSHQR